MTDNDELRGKNEDLLLERVGLMKHRQPPHSNLQSKLKLSFYLAQVNWA